MHNEINYKAVPNRSALNQPVKNVLSVFIWLTFVY